MTELWHQPPAWLAAVVVAIFVAHALDKLIEVATKRRGHNGLIPVLELFVVFVLGFLAIHAYFEGMLVGADHANWADQPFALVVALIGFALASAVLYMKSRETGR